MAFPDIHAADLRGWTALHHAVQQDDKTQLMQLLQAGADPEACTAAGNTSLHLAAKAGHIHLIPHLTTPTTLDSQNSQGFTPLQEALLCQQWEAAAMLVAAGASPYGVNTTPSSSSLAVPLEEVPAPSQLFKAMLADASPMGLVAQAMRWKNQEGMTALHTAARDGSVERVQNLLDAGAKKDGLTTSLATPLWYAAASGHAQLFPLLATPRSLDFPARGYARPLHVAAEGGHVLMVEQLLAAGAEPEPYDMGWHSPLNLAVQQCHLPVVSLLLEALVRRSSGTGQQEREQQRRRREEEAAEQYEKQQALRFPRLPAVGHTQPSQRRPPPRDLVLPVSLAMAPLARRLQDAPRCTWFLGVVLDMLGPDTAGQVCQKVHQELQFEWGASESTSLYGIGWQSIGRDNNRLAEALLLGWLGAEARRLVPARLQRLVPGVASSQQQQQQQQPEDGQQQQQQQGKEAVLAISAGHQQQASDLLQAWVGGHLQQPGHSLACVSIASVPTPRGTPVTPPEGLAAPETPPAHPSCSTQEPTPVPEPVAPLVQLVHEGLMAAAATRLDREGLPQIVVDAALPEPVLLARFSRTPKVHASFLSAWVAARAAPNAGLARTVVAAVTSAKLQQEAATEQQQQQQQNQQQEEGSNKEDAPV
jgi:ankyrin repeat protein